VREFGGWLIRNEAGVAGKKIGLGAEADMNSDTPLPDFD
jgi:hypothetical protein